HHLAVDGHGNTAARRLHTAQGHGVRHARAVAELARLAVQGHVHAALPVSGTSRPASSSPTAFAVIGASSTPPRWCPVAHRSPSGPAAPTNGRLSGVPGLGPAPT